MAMATATALAIGEFAAPMLGTLGGAVMTSRASGKASEAQERAAREALAFEREREAANRAERERYDVERRRQWDAWQAMRLGLMKRYGMSVTPGAPVRGGSLTLGRLAEAPVTPEVENSAALVPRPTRRTLGDLGAWNEWGV